MWFATHGTGAIRSATPTDRILGAGSAIWFYLSKTLLPMNLVFIYPQWHIQPANSLWWIPLLAAAIVTAFLWRCRPSSPWTRTLFFAWAIFCTALLPVMGFADTVYMQFSLVADHYQHIALIAVVALAAAGWSIWRRRSAGIMRSATMVSAVGVIGLLTSLTWNQCSLYRDTLTLYTATLQRNPKCWAIQTNLGLMLANAGHFQEAIELFSQALRIQPDFAKAHNNLGMVLASSGRLQEAIEHFEHAVQSKPNFPEAHNNLGNALSDSGRLPEAIQQYRLALAIRPDYPKAHNNLGMALASTGSYAEAIDEFQQALDLQPAFADAHANLGTAFSNTGRTDEAIQQFQKTLQLKPNNWPTYIALAQSYASLHRSAEAIATVQTGLDLARSQGQAKIAEQFENWLASYKAALPNPP
jgi:tetratricopeptide (TPR) repeat protein